MHLSWMHVNESGRRDATEPTRPAPGKRGRVSLPAVAVIALACLAVIATNSRRHVPRTELIYQLAPGTDRSPLTSAPLVRGL
jgi:hypothetical protein